MHISRPRRTTIAGVRARLASDAADVINVSCGGALVRTARQQRPGAEWPLVLEIDDTAVQLIARVVRCEPVAGPLQASTGKFTLGLQFVNPPPDAVKRLEQVCRSGRRPGEGVRRLHVSLSRRCPKCGSHDVAKEARRQYSCGQCGEMFTGFRVGFLRFAH